MDTKQFLETILAAEGLKCLFETHPDGKRRQFFYQSVEEMADKAQRHDAAGWTVYHACATFSSESRKAEAAAYMQSFWVDADVAPDTVGKYATAKDAATDLHRVCGILGLPFPLVIRSGRGIHAYWVLTEAIEAATWRVIAERFKKVLHHLEFLQDTTRTADAASVLRPVGTHWRKDGEREVRMVTQMHPIALATFVGALDAYEEQHDIGAPSLPTVPEHLKALAVDNDDLGTPIEYPPSSADRVAQMCPTIQYVAERQGDVEEPLWRAMIGVVKHTTEGEQRCHEWSMGHPKYDEAETQDKIDRWTVGPTTCAAMRMISGNQCAGCGRQCTSPVQLGYTEAGTAKVEVPVPDEDGDFEIAQLAHFPKRQFHWNQQSLCRAMQNEDGEIEWIPFTDTLFYPVRRLRKEDGEWHLNIRFLRQDKQWDEFDLPTRHLGEKFGLAAQLAAHEIILTGPKGQNHVVEYLRTYLLDLQKHGVEQTTYSFCGWVEDNSAVVIGNRHISLTTEKEILAGKHVRAAGYARDLGRSGSVQDWVTAVDSVYNRPGAEPYQFAIAAAFASPLVDITQAQNWHGIPIAITGGGGNGKTTVAKVACSIYGTASEFLIASGKQAATFNALMGRIGVMRHLPVIFDEFTNREHHEVCDLMYNLSNGKPKDRMKSDGTMMEQVFDWKAITFLTSNNSIQEELRQLEQRDVTEATQVRVFEIHLPEGYSTAIWGAEGGTIVDTLEHKLLAEQYGEVGRVWLRYVIENRDKLRAEIRKLRTQFDGRNKDESKERYYRDLTVAVAVALKHATKLGLLRFPMNPLVKWAKANTVRLRANRQQDNYSWDDYIAMYLADLRGRILYTRRFGDGRSALEMPLENMVNGVAVAARIAQDDKMFLVTVKSINDWCKDNKQQPNQLIDEMDKRGYVVHRKGETQKNGSRRERITRGTNLPSAQAFCLELDYNWACGIVSDEKSDGKVVPFPAKEDTAKAEEAVQ